MRNKFGKRISKLKTVLMWLLICSLIIPSSMVFAATKTLTVSPTSFTLNPGAGSKTITVTSNSKWGVIESSAWISVSKESGSGNGTFKIYVAANNSAKARSGVVTVTSGEVTRKITVKQNGIVLSVSNVPINVSNGAAFNKSVTVTCNRSWSVTGGASWLTVTKNSSSITLKASRNTTFKDRNTTITVKSGNVSKKFSVSQGFAYDGKVTTTKTIKEVGIMPLTTIVGDVTYNEYYLSDGDYYKYGRREVIYHADVKTANPVEYGVMYASFFPGAKHYSSKDNLLKVYSLNQTLPAWFSGDDDYYGAYVNYDVVKYKKGSKNYVTFGWYVTIDNGMTYSNSYKMQLK